MATTGPRNERDGSARISCMLYICLGYLFSFFFFSLFCVARASFYNSPSFLRMNWLGFDFNALWDGWMNDSHVLLCKKLGVFLHTFNIMRDGLGSWMGGVAV